MDKNGYIPSMYESIPAVSALNRVPGFEPLKLLRRVISPENGKEALQLDLRYKKLWFRLANPKGRIRLNPLRVTEQVAVFEAQVYLDRSDAEPAGCFTSCFTKEGSPDGRYVQAAQYEAMDEALTDAGFGLQFADLAMGREENGYGSVAALPDAVPAGQEASSPGMQEAQGMPKAGKAVPVQEAPVQPANASVSAKTAGAVDAAQEKTACGTRTVLGVKSTVQGQQGNEDIQGQAVGNALSAPSGNQAPVSSRVSGETVSGMGTGKQGAASVVAQAQKPAAEKRAVQGNALPVQPSVVKNAPVQQAAAPQAQGSQAVGSAKAFHPVLAQVQHAQKSGNGGSAQQMKKQAGIVGTPVAQARTAPGSGSTQPVQLGTVECQIAPNAAAGTLPADKAGINSLPVQQGAMGAGVIGVGKLPVNTAGTDSLPVQSRTMKTGATGAETLPVNVAGTDSLPVQPRAIKTEATGAEALPVNAAGTGSLPVQAADTGTAAVSGKILQMKGKAGGQDQMQDSVQAAMALLGGQKKPVPGAVPPVAGQGPVPTGIGTAGQALPVSGSVAAEGQAPRYTADMPMEEIVKLMTLEEAGGVVVDAGVCKGQTIAEVAQRRPASLKFYLYGGYKGDNNILCAAAKVMMDAMAAQKAG